MTFLETLLATLLPGDENWPSGALVAADVAADAPDAVVTLAAALPSFTVGNEAALRAAMRTARRSRSAMLYHPSILHSSTASAPVPRSGAIPTKTPHEHSHSSRRNSHPRRTRPLRLLARTGCRGAGDP